MKSVHKPNNISTLSPSIHSGLFFQNISVTQGKIPGSVKKWKVPDIKCITSVKHQNNKIKTVSKDHGGFQQQSPQHLVDRYEHMNNQNDRLTMRLKAI